MREKTAFFVILGTILMSFGVFASGCGNVACTEPPETYEGAELTGCSSSGEIECCSYSGDNCSYVLCSEGCNDEYTEDSWSCY